RAPSTVMASKSISFFMVSSVRLHRNDASFQFSDKFPKDNIEQPIFKGFCLRLAIHVQQVGA
ncbi:MAG: hypothetical protein ACK5AJ_09495, partial [bacterium]